MELDPLKRWDQIEKEHPELLQAGQNPNWVWVDKYLTNDFKMLRNPNPDISTRIMLLKSFYMFYFGEITPSSNMGSLFVQIVASTPHLAYGEGEGLVHFCKEGKTELSKFTPPENLEMAFSRFQASHSGDTSPVLEEIDEVAAPTEPMHTGLVDEEPTIITEEDNARRPVAEVKRITKEDIDLFKRNIITAFSQILVDPEDSDINRREVRGSVFKEKPLTLPAYRSLHHTAFFLILFLMRRITKRPEDLSDALARANIHKHYTDMVPNPFGMTIPAPSEMFNRNLDQILSVQSLPSRELYTIALWLLQSNKQGILDQPVGLLAQKDLGLEAMLMATCMMHIAGAGLPLITLFIAVKTLYNKTERATLEWLAYPELIGGISKIVNLRATQFKLMKEKTDLKLFPYCRLIHQNYHHDLAHRGNEQLCYLMACLVDLHSPPVMGTGGARNAFWTFNMNARIKSQIQDAANKMYSGASSFKLTKKYPGQISYGLDEQSGVTWKGTHKPASTSDDEEEDNGSFSPIQIR